MRDFSFTRWLQKKETFSTYAQYKYWLSIMPKDEAKKVNLYYHEKFEYWKKYLQTEFD